MAPPGPVKIGHKKDGWRRQPHRFHVSWPPPLPGRWICYCIPRTLLDLPLSRHPPWAGRHTPPPWADNPPGFDPCICAHASIGGIPVCTVCADALPNEPCGSSFSHLIQSCQEIFRCKKVNSSGFSLMVTGSRV